MGFFRELEDDIKDLGRDIDDEILQPVKNTVEAIIEDPKKLIGVAIAVAFPGAGAALGAQLGLSGVAAQVVGQAIINTATNGGDVKAAVIGAALPVVGQQASQAIGNTLTQSGITGSVNAVITDAATRGLTAAALGKDPLAAMVLSGTTSAVNLIAAEIPGFDGLHPSAQSAIKNAVATKLNGGSVGQSLVDSAVSYATNEVTTYKKRESAMSALAEAGLDFGSDYSSLDPEQQAAIDAIAKAPPAKTQTESFFDRFFGRPTPQPGTTQPELIEKYKDSLYTDESEAYEMAKAILGREPTEFEAMEFIGTSESNAKSVLEGIRYDEATFDSNELAEAYKAVYGKEPTAEWLASDEAMDMLGRSDAQGKNMLQEVYTKDKNWVTEDEAKQFWKDTGNTGPAPQEFVDAMLMTTESGAKAMAETHRINAEDIAATTFDGSKYKTPQEAAAAAKAAGFNAFTHKDKNLTYFTQPSPIEEANIRADVEEKKTFSEAFAAARKELGAGKTFTWNGKQYTTNVMPKDTFDASRSSTITTAATLALANGKDKFIGPDGKTYKLDDNAKSVLANSVNQSAAETQRLLNLKPTTDETPAETQRLMEAGTRGTMDTIGAMTAQALGTTQRGLGNFLSNAGKTYAAMTGDLSFDNAAIKLGKEIETYAKGNDIYGLDVQKNRLSQAMARANETDNWFEKTKILGSAIGSNSLGFFDVAGSEIVEELPETVLQIGAALMTGGTSLAAKGAVAAIGAAGSVMETFGSTVEETYDKAKKAGFSNSEAMDKAYLNGVLSTAIEAGTNFVADKALLAPFLNKFTGTLAGTATGFVSSTAIGAASELAAGLSQSYATQYMIDPETASLSKAATDGIFEMFIGGTAQGAMGLPGYAIQGGAIIGKDYSGRDVTMADVAAGAVLDSSTVNPNAAIATSEDGDPVTLGGAMLQMPNYQFDMSTLKTYVPQVFNNDKLIVGKDELGNNVTYGELMGQTTKSMDFDTLHKNLLNTTPEQSKEAQTKLITDTFKSAGYTASAAEINALIAAKPTGTTAIKDSVSTYVAPRQVTEAEAKKFFADIGYKPTDAEVKQFVKSGGNVSETAVKADVAKYVAPLQVTDADARKFFADIGYKPTDAEVKQFVKQAKDADVLKEVYSYVDPRQVTKAEAEKFFADLGYKPTKAEIDSYIKQGNANTQAELVAEVAKYVAPRIVTEQEAKDAYAALGLKNPTKADIDKLVGQYDQTGLTGRATENLDTARYNSIIDQLGSITGVTPADVTTAISDYMKANPGLSKTDVETAISTYMKDNPGLTKTDLSTAISTATKDFATKKDIETAISNIKFPAGITKEDVADEIKKAMEANPGLTAEDVTKSITDYMTANPGLTAADLDTAISTATKDLATTKQLTDLQDSLAEEIQAAKDIGLEGDAAIQAGLDSLAEKVGTNQADLLTQLGTTAADLKTQFATDIAVSQEATAQEIADTRTALETAIADAKAAGLEGDEALKAAIDAVAADQQTNAADLLDKLGTTEANLKTEFAEGLAGVSTEIADTRKALEDAIQAAKDIGLEGDAALQAGIDSVAAELGTTKEALLTQLGTTEETLRTEFATGISGLETQMKEQYDALTTAQKETADALVAQGKTLADAIAAAQKSTATQISDVETRLTDAIAAAEAAGLTRDEAITSAVESVAADLGTTKADLLTQLGTTEETLRTEFSTGLAGVSAEVKAAYDSLSAEQKALATQLNQQGIDLATAIQQAQEQTAGAIETLSADVQAKYDALTADQKALANAMNQQGLDLTAAIDLAAQQTQAQITGLGEQVDTRINELMQQGQTYQQATQQAIGELNTQNQQLQSLVGTQGRQATQADIDALSQMLGGQRSMDLTYDVTGDKQITQADIDFLTQVVSGVNTDWKAPVGSAFGPTGLYGQLATNEAQRQADLQAQLAREEAARQAEAERQRLAAEEAARQGKISDVRGTAAKGQQAIQQLAGQLPQAFQQAQQTTTPLYATMDYFDPFSDPFGDPFGTQKLKMASSTNPADQTKMAAGGYIDDLLAGEMTVDDLLNLLR